MNFKLLFVLLIAISLTSCRSKKKVLYFQNSSVVEEQCSYNYELKIQTDDLLYINVMGTDMETVKVFNQSNGDIGLNNNIRSSNIAGGNNNGSGGNNNKGNNSNNISANTNNGATPVTIGYLVDNYGDIEFPVLGRIKVVGLTKSSVAKLLEEKLSQYVKDPVVKIRFLNFKVTVLGETQSGAQTVTFDTEKVSLPQLLSQVGDLSLFSVRNNVVIIREVDGVKTLNRVDLTQANIINSPYYYLAQNDVVYIEPSKNKIDSNAIPTVLKNAAIILGMAASVFFLINKI